MFCATKCIVMLKTTLHILLPISENIICFSLSHFFTLSCTLASCEIVLIKHNHLCQVQKIGYHDLMALKYKEKQHLCDSQRIGQAV